jgi:hypothetical protein
MKGTPLTVEVEEDGYAVVLFHSHRNPSRQPHLMVDLNRGRLY